MHPPQVPLIEGCPGRTPLAGLAPKTHHKNLSNQLDPHQTPKTHAKISPVATPLSAPSAATTHKQSSTMHHITDIMCSRSSSK
jgi:hypothetical protein